MCQRFYIHDPGLLPEALGIAQEIPFMNPLFNIRPTDPCPIVRINARNERVLSMVRWGLIPHWSKSMPEIQPRNARCETVMTNGMFREAFERRRCLIPASGFYEWDQDKSKKQAYQIRREDRKIVVFAGLWERWQSTDSFTMITTSANDAIKGIHHRMPVEIEPENFGPWLDRSLPGEKVAHLMQSSPPENWRVIPIKKVTDDGVNLS